MAGNPNLLSVGAAPIVAPAVIRRHEAILAWRDDGNHARHFVGAADIGVRLSPACHIGSTCGFGSVARSRSRPAYRTATGTRRVEPIALPRVARDEVAGHNHHGVVEARSAPDRRLPGPSSGTINSKSNTSSAASRPRRVAPSSTGCGSFA